MKISPKEEFKRMIDSILGRNQNKEEENVDIKNDVSDIEIMYFETNVCQHLYLGISDIQGKKFYIFKDDEIGKAKAKLIGEELIAWASQDKENE